MLYTTKSWLGTLFTTRNFLSRSVLFILAISTATGCGPTISQIPEDKETILKKDSPWPKSGAQSAEVPKITSRTSEGLQPGADPPPKPRVIAEGFKGRLAVMPLEDLSNSLDAKLIDDLTNYIRSRLTSNRSVMVIDRSRQSAKLKELLENEKKESYRACYSRECQVPLGQALSADHILRSTLIRIGSVYSLSLELVDLASETTLGGASGECPANPRKGRIDRLLQVVRDSVDAL